MLNTELSYRAYPGSKTSARQQEAILILSECLDPSTGIKTLSDLDDIRKQRSIKLRHASITHDEWGKSIKLEFVERSDSRIAGSVWANEPNGNRLGYQFEFVQNQEGSWNGKSRWFNSKPGTDPWSDDGAKSDWREIRPPN